MIFLLFSLECGLSETCIPIRYYSAFLFNGLNYRSSIGLEWFYSTVFWYFMYITVLWSLYSLLLRTLHHLKKCLLLFEITTLFSFFSWILVRVAFFSSNVRVRSRPAARLLLFKKSFLRSTVKLCAILEQTRVPDKIFVSYNWFVGCWTGSCWVFFLSQQIQFFVISNQF